MRRKKRLIANVLSRTDSAFHRLLKWCHTYSPGIANDFLPPASGEGTTAARAVASEDWPTSLHTTFSLVDGVRDDALLAPTLLQGHRLFSICEAVKFRADCLNTRLTGLNDGWQYQSSDSDAPRTGAHIDDHIVAVEAGKRDEFGLEVNAIRVASGR